MFKLALCLFYFFSFISYAQEKKQETDNSYLISPLIINYPLTEDLLLKLEKINNECKNSSLDLEKTNTKSDSTTDHDSNDTIENYTADISKNPKLVKILRENNLTPKEFVIANLALQTTLIALTNKEHPIYEKNVIPSSNIEFAKEHMYRIIKILKSSC
ncbi:hypothetical protein ABID23_000137 [Bartonella silvatica]|uniref:DUF4142 domain-containing protein n=1 Tax=Bartonella silvatica TaxID=357760 RepID=A0ABV2HF83_9HYPH